MSGGTRRFPFQAGRKHGRVRTREGFYRAFRVRTDTERSGKSITNSETAATSVRPIDIASGTRKLFAESGDLPVMLSSTACAPISAPVTETFVRSDRVGWVLTILMKICARSSERLAVASR